MDEYVQLYGLNHWGDSFLSYSRHRIEHYIKPHIGNVLLTDLTTHGLDRFYDSLRDQPAVVLKGHKDTGKTVSLPVIEKVHALMRSALNQAVTWGYIPVNPALKVTLPKYKAPPRQVWSAEEAQTALELCDDPILHLAMLLALGCSMQIGEILGLTWDCIEMSEESIQDGTACVCINKELKRCDMPIPTRRTGAVLRKRWSRNSFSGERKWNLRRQNHLQPPLTVKPKTV